MDFRERLHRASERGQRARDTQAREAAAKALSEEECRRLHSSYRLALCDYIEKCLHDLADNFPGFRVETIVDDAGWGSTAVRDDVGLARRRADNFFSRNHYQRLDDVDLDRFRELIEQWVLDYAELFAASG